MTPVPADIGPLLPWLDRGAIALFAATGTVAAIRSGQSFSTAAFFAIITGTGGGTVRDLLIGAPVYWVDDRMVAGLCLVSALMVWFTPERWWRGRVFAWLDAMGLAAYAVFGAAKAVDYGLPPVSAGIMGVVTACVGGILRDTLANEPSILLRREIYVTAAGVAAALYVVLNMSALPTPWPSAIAALAGFGLRVAAIQWNLALPSYRGMRALR